jgi:hypothetical protein
VHFSNLKSIFESAGPLLPDLETSDFDGDDSDKRLEPLIVIPVEKQLTDFRGASPCLFILYFLCFGISSLVSSSLTISTCE